MALLSIQNLLLALVIVVPGFISTHTAISLGVVRTEMSSWRLLIVSLSSSVFVDAVFIAIAQLLGQSVRGPNEVESLFFNPNFQPFAVFGLLFLSILVGVIGAVMLAANWHTSAREAIWKRFGDDRHRNPLEPWEGVLDEANRIQILTSDGAILVGQLYKYSDDGKEKQIAVKNPEWNMGDCFEDSNSEIELVLEEDIMSISVLTLKD